MLDWDTRRYTVQEKCHRDALERSPIVAARYAAGSGINGVLRGRNQFPAVGFHTLLAQKIDSQIDRSETLREHSQIKYDKRKSALKAMEDRLAKFSNSKL